MLTLFSYRQGKMKYIVYIMVLVLVPFAAIYINSSVPANVVQYRWRLIATDAIANLLIKLVRKNTRHFSPWFSLIMPITYIHQSYSIFGTIVALLAKSFVIQGITAY